MDVKLVNRMNVLEVQESLWSQIESIVRWEATPNFRRHGRTALLSLNEPLNCRINDCDHSIACVKIKGVGLKDQNGAISRPTSTKYCRLHSHMGFSIDGEFVELFSPATPLGGITLDRAQAEFSAAERMLKTWSHGPVPLCCFEYVNERFLRCGEELPLGVVCLGLPSKNDGRFEELLDGCVNSSTIPWSFGHSLGEALSRYHTSGLFRFSGYPSNYTKSASSALLVDLDSSIGFTNLTDIQVFLYRCRDLCSIIFGILNWVLKKRPETQMVEGFVEFTTSAILAYSGTERCGPSKTLLNSFRQLFDICLSRRPVSRPVPSTNDGREVGSKYEAFRRENFRQWWIDRNEVYCLVLGCLLSEGFGGGSHTLSYSWWRDQSIQFCEEKKLAPYAPVEQNIRTAFEQRGY